MQDLYNSCKNSSLKQIFCYKIFTAWVKYQNSSVELRLYCVSRIYIYQLGYYKYHQLNNSSLFKNEIKIQLAQLWLTQPI